MTRRDDPAGARASFLTRASAQLGSSLDEEKTLAGVAQLAIPEICDWCAIEVVRPDGALRAVAVAHVDPAKTRLVEDLLRLRRSDDRRAAPLRVVRTGQAELHAEVSDPTLVADPRIVEQLRIAVALDIRSAIVAPIKSDGTIGVVTFAATSSRRYDAEDLAMVGELGHRVGAAIANARLFARASEAAALREEILAIAGHELRTPLTTILLQVDAMLRLPDTARFGDVRERLRRISAQAQRIGNLAEDLLDLGRISAAELMLVRQDVDLASIVMEVASRLASDPRRGAGELVVDVEPAIGHWDRVRVEQIATDLITSALRHGRGKPVEITVRRLDDVGVLTISDRRIAIDAKDQSRILDHSERAIPARKLGGLGLRLWIARRLVDAHGGSVSVENRPGDGSTFTVRLPLSSS
jgi:signal transduction histidine kinase